MSDHLPDDPAEWPDNPYSILGVPHGVEEKELKRAYVRLIRRFKPEQYPEQFQRLREAYETLQRWAAFHLPAPPPQPREILPPPEPSLLDVIDSLLNKGVVLNADVILALANVDLIYLRLSALLCAADRVLPRRSRGSRR